MWIFYNLSCLFIIIMDPVGYSSVGVNQQVMSHLSSCVVLALVSWICNVSIRGPMPVSVTVLGF